MKQFELHLLHYAMQLLLQPLLVPLLVLESGRAVPRVSVGDNCTGRGDCVVIDATAAPGTTSGGKAGKTEGWLTGLEPATPRITI